MIGQMSSTARFLWMMQVLEVNPDDSILEIGCGVGVGVSLIAARLESGRITAIDRSPSALNKAVSRNEKYILERKAEFFLTDIARFKQGIREYDKIFAFNVNVFWTKKSIAQEVQVIQSHLSKNGRLYLFYQPPSEQALDVLRVALTEKLNVQGLLVTDSVYDQAVRSCCIMAKAKKPD